MALSTLPVMPPPSSLLRISHIIRSLRPPPSRRFLTTSTLRQASTSIPSIQQCPPSTCACAPMPEGLAIDRKRELNGTMPPYAQHVVIHTGRNDWSSRIEDEADEMAGEQAGGGVRRRNLAKALKGLVGRGGKFHDPSHPILITNSSLPRIRHEGSNLNPEHDQHVLRLFPRDIFIPNLPDTPDAIEDFARRFLCSADGYTSWAEIPNQQRANHEHAGYCALNRIGDCMNSLGNPKLPHCKIDRSRRDLTVLICGHMSRDSRCGTLAPILKAEFERHLPQLRHAIRDKFPNRFAQHHREQIAVGSCSHIGGHAFAGNVVIYFPKRTWVKGWESGLAGKGIWYGRVEPRHVARIIEQTILQGKIIQELLRGVHDPAGA